MPLLVFSDELLLQIFSEHDILDTKDYIHLIHTCRRIYHIALPQLYHTVTFSWGSEIDSEPEMDEYFAQTLKSYSEHRAYVRAAHVFWSQREMRLSDTMFSTLLSFSFLERLSLKGIPVIEFGRRFNRPLPPPPSQNSAFTDFLGRCFELTALRSLDIEYRNLRVHEIDKFYCIPGLEHLKCNRFDATVESLYPRAETPSVPNPTTITHLEFWNSSEPAGPFAEYLLASHPRLEELVWVVDTRLARMPGDYLKAFRSLLPYLTKLHLSYSSSNCGDWEIEMDFKAFVALKELDVHHRLIFGERTFPRNIRSRSINREAIVEKLPALLESLTITFDGDSSVFRSKQSESMNYSWILALAQHKDASYKHLSRVVLLERRGREYMASSVVESGSTEWVYPQDVQDTYKGAQIVLRVFNWADITL